MREVILNAKHHIKDLLGYLDVMGGNFDGMQDARDFLERLEKWESLKPEEQAKRENWIKIGTFTLEELSPAQDEADFEED